MTDNNNNFFSLPETTVDNETYNNAVAAKQQLETQIRNEQAMPAASAETLAGYETIIKNYDTIMRVEGNKLHKVQISSITNFATYKCAVYYQGSYIGTGSIVLSNRLDTDGGYSLVINNGQQVFKYNEDGVSPTSNSVENPYEPLALSFTIYDNLGKPLEDDIAKKCKIRWMVPNHDNMVKATTVHQPIDQNDDYKIYNDYTLNYQIDNKYNVSKKNNNIRLQVTYKELSLTRDTDFTFAKEGDPGTNGTEFLCRIVPNTNNDLGGLVPMVVDNGSIRVPNFTPINTGKWFRVELWHSGERIFANTTTGQTTEGKTATVVWSMLRNKYTSSISDTGNISVNADGTFSASAYVGDSTPAPANIVKCQITYDKVVYYATLPLVTTRVYNDYQVGLYENTGFQFVTYGADGRKSSYDNAEPFRLKVTNLINNIREDISEMTQSNAVTYSWFIKGSKNDKIVDPETQAATRDWVNDINLALDTYNNQNAKRNEKYFKPNDDYDTETVTNAIECDITKNNSTVARIHIPIHFLINKYGHKELNGWDGNSIQLDQEGGFILAPEMGAGEKDNQNRFTGVLMGKVKEANHTNYMIGLHGYHEGQKSFFLNSKNGSAFFGKQGNSQIIIDPSTSSGYLYSSSFWKNTNFNEDGLPKDYSWNSSSNKYNQQSDSGLLIDLTTPRIIFGNQNFRVDPTGYMYAKGGGKIAGWNIDDDSMWTGTKENTYADGDVRLSTVDFTRNINGVNRNGLRFALGSRFGVTKDGTMYAGDAILGTGTNKITLGKSSGDNAQSAIYSGDKSAMSVNNKIGFYLGVDGISLGSRNSSKGYAPFEVDSNGSLKATSGMIGNITIGDTGLYYSGTGSTDGFGLWKSGTHSHNNSYIIFHAGGNNGNIGDAGFRVYQNGSMYSTKGNIGGWNISSVQLQKQTGDYSFEIRTDRASNQPALLVYHSSQGYKWYVRPDGHMYAGSADISGKITATSGVFENVTIKDSCTINGVRLDSDFLRRSNMYDGFVNNSKLGSGSVSTGKIQDLAVTNGKINSISADKITTGTLDVGDSSYYIKHGFGDTQHPRVSGLNVYWGGIRMNNHGIVDIGSLHIYNEGYGKDVSFQVMRQGGGYYYITFKSGIVTAYEVNT